MYNMHVPMWSGLVQSYSCHTAANFSHTPQAYVI